MAALPNAAASQQPEAVHPVLLWWPVVLLALGVAWAAAKRAAEHLVIGPRREQARLAKEVQQLRGAMDRACSVADDTTRRLDRHHDQLASMSERIDRILEHMLER